jgi:Asp-tRNA(Asn)/Glu-tRNA(Gln) amidotransferase A subunit family amidase
VQWRNDAEIKRLKIGYFEDDGRTPVTPGLRDAVRTAADALKRAGFQVEPFRPEGLDQAREIWRKLFVKVGGDLIGPMFQGRQGDLSPTLKQFLDMAGREPALIGDGALQAWFARDSLRIRFVEQMRKYPILLCPSAAIPAFRHGERSWSIEGKTVEYLDAWSYTAWFNLLGNPAVVVPVSQSNDGLPIGVQIVGRPWHEEEVLSIAAVLERECGGFRIPPIT